MISIYDKRLFAYDKCHPLTASNSVKCIFSVSLFVGFWLSVANAMPQEKIKVGIAQLPELSDSAYSGVLVNLMQKVNEDYLVDQLEIMVLPFSRSLLSLANNKIDVHLPIIYDESIASSNQKIIPKRSHLLISDFHFSQQVLFQVPFVILTHADTGNIKSLKSQRYHIETDASHLPFFNILMHGSYCISCSVGKVMKKRIDGYLFASTEIKSVIKELDFERAQIAPFKTYEARFLVRKNEMGLKVATRLDSALQKMKEDKSYGEIMSVLLVSHD